jgi:hypothetical protein
LLSDRDCHAAAAAAAYVFSGFELPIYLIAIKQALSADADQDVWYRFGRPTHEAAFCGNALVATSPLFDHLVREQQGWHVDA